MPKIYIVILLSSLLLQGAVYEGKIGKYPIVMLLGEKSEDTNRYRYDGKLLSIPLIGKPSTKLCEANSQLKRDDETFVPFACFEGEVKGDEYSGVWHKIGTQKRLPFSLKLVKLPKKIDIYGDPYSDEEFYYDLLRKEIKFKRLKDHKSSKGLSYHTAIEPVTKMAQYRIELPDKSVQKQINESLRNIHKESVVEQIWCIDEGSVDEAYNEYMIDIEYFKKPFLLLSYESSSYCGGAHPNNAYEQYLFDLSSGKEIYYDQFFVTYQKNSDGDEVIRPLFQKLLHRYLIKESEIDSCYHKDDNSYHLTLYPTDGERVAVRLRGMGHASFACELEPIALIPLEEMKPFITQKALKYYPQ